MNSSYRSPLKERPKMRQGGTRKRPAPGKSPLAQDNIHEIKNRSGNSKSPRTDIPYEMSMQAIPSSGPANQSNFNYNDNYPTNGYGEDYYNNMQPTNPSENFSNNNELVKVLGGQLTRYEGGFPVARTEFEGSPINAENNWQGDEQYDDLDQRALVAQRDAQSKRKQIPPFVQKLSSFLDGNLNTDLIRWSDSGDSFIVVDEDEFAKTLIPELFKHNNYASFVRQLNMYGFHKKVGLSDNSMRASERKNKNPSEYSNPYFKRGKPNLLWLIHKPKNPPSKSGGKNSTRAKQEDADDDVEDYFPRDSPAPVEDRQAGWTARQPLMLGTSENTLPPDQLQNLQRELDEIRKNQQSISKMLKDSRQENMQLSRAYHQLHEKHDNSINAILTFLATVYNKNLKEGGVNFGNMFGPNSLPQKDQEHGNIVEFENDKDQSPMAPPYQPSMRMRPRLLLKDKASPANSGESPEQLNQWPEGTFPHPTKATLSPSHSPAIQEINDRTPSACSSPSPQVHPDRNTDTPMPSADVISVLNNTSAHNNSNITGPTMDFTEALSHLQTADGQSPLTPLQRDDMLRLMEQNSPQNGNNNNNALTSYSPPNQAANLAHFNMSTEQLNQIEQSLREQEARMANMQATIAPLSPSGSIPGVHDQNYNANSQELDLDSIFNSGDYFNEGTDPNNFDFSNGAELPDFDFGTGTEPVNGENQNQGPAQLDGLNEMRVKEVDSSEATSPANTVDEGAAAVQMEGSPRKLRRRG